MTENIRYGRLDAPDAELFAAAEAESVAEPLHEEHEDIRMISEEHAESASTSADWNQEFRRPEAASLPDLGWPGETIVKVEEEAAREEQSDPLAAVDEPSGRSQRDDTPAFAAPGTMEEETIDEEEADTLHYESTSDEGYDEFEEETQAGPGQLNGEARETVAEIHHASLTESGDAHPAGTVPAEVEEDSEEIELEEAMNILDPFS